MALPATERSPRFRPDRSGVLIPLTEFDHNLRELSSGIDQLTQGQEPTVENNGYVRTELYAPIKQTLALGDLVPDVAGLVRLADGTLPEETAINVAYQLSKVGEGIGGERHKFSLRWTVENNFAVAGIVVEPSPARLRVRGTYHRGTEQIAPPKLLQGIELRDGVDHYVDPYFKTGQESIDESRRAAYHAVGAMRFRSGEEHLRLFDGFVTTLGQNGISSMSPSSDA